VGVERGIVVELTRQAVPLPAGGDQLTDVDGSRRGVWEHCGAQDIPPLSWKCRPPVERSPQPPIGVDQSWPTVKRSPELADSALLRFRRWMQYAVPPSSGYTVSMTGSQVIERLRQHGCLVIRRSNANPILGRDGCADEDVHRYLRARRGRLVG